MTRRTKTYIAGDWDGDSGAIERLYEWKNSGHLTLDFNDAHSLTQARDGSLNCSIKRSLTERLNASKTIVLIVGINTKTVKSGGCQLCDSYNSWTKSCSKGHVVDYRSYIEYECEKAVRDDLRIVILYNAASVNKSKCPDSIKTFGTHTAMWKIQDGRYLWDYLAAKKALEP